MSVWEFHSEENSEFKVFVVQFMVKSLVSKSSSEVLVYA